MSVEEDADQPPADGAEVEAVGLAAELDDLIARPYASRQFRQVPSEPPTLTIQDIAQARGWSDNREAHKPAVRALRTGPSEPELVQSFCAFCGRAAVVNRHHACRACWDSTKNNPTLVKVTPKQFYGKAASVEHPAPSSAELWRMYDHLVRQGSKPNKLLTLADRQREGLWWVLVGGEAAHKARRKVPGTVKSQGIDYHPVVPLPRIGDRHPWQDRPWRRTRPAWHRPELARRTSNRQRQQDAHLRAWLAANLVKERLFRCPVCLIVLTAGTKFDRFLGCDPCAQAWGHAHKPWGDEYERFRDDRRARQCEALKSDPNHIRDPHVHGNKWRTHLERPRSLWSEEQPAWVSGCRGARPCGMAQVVAA